MRGFQRPAVKHSKTDLQSDFRALSRHRKTKVARAAQTTLVKADQWGRGEATPPEVASALEAALKGIQSKGAKKK